MACKRSAVRTRYSPQQNEQPLPQRLSSILGKNLVKNLTRKQYNKMLYKPAKIYNAGVTLLQPGTFTSVGVLIWEAGSYASG
jgi:hypothetical protein